MIKAMSVLGAAIALSASLTMTATPAVAAGSCSIVVPAKAQIAATTTVITAHLGSDCVASDTLSARWDVSVGDRYSFGFLADRPLVSSYTFFAFDTVGVRRAVPTGAVNSSFTQLTQNSPTYVVKYATWTYTASSRAPDMEPEFL